MVITKGFLWAPVMAHKDLPLYWAWFLQDSDSSTFINTSREMLTISLLEIPEFFSNIKQFTNETTADGIIDYYSRSDPYSNELHCTAMFNGFYPNYTDGAEDYAARLDVKENIGKPFTLHSIGWILTPRTFGARLRLTQKQLILWNNMDAEVKNPLQDSTKYHLDQIRERNGISIIPQDPDILGNFQPTSGKGSRAHLTLGCAPGVDAVTTGLDLVDIIEQESIADESTITYNLTNGWLRSYGQDRWVFYPQTQFLLDSQFRGYTNEATTSTASLLKNFGLVMFIFMSTNKILCQLS